MQNSLVNWAKSPLALEAVEKIFDVIDWSTADIEPETLYYKGEDGEYRETQVKCPYCMYLRGMIYGMLLAGIASLLIVWIA